MTFIFLSILIALQVYSAIMITILLKKSNTNNKMIEEQKQEDQIIPTEVENTPEVAQPVDEDAQAPVSDEPLRFVIDIPKSVDNGEDAPPLVMDLNRSLEGSPETTSVLLGVFDGMGGAGSQKVTLADGTQKTNAYVASRATRRLVEQFFSTWNISGDDLEQALKICIQNGLKEKDKELQAYAPTQPSRFISTLHKKLPTTMSLAWFQNMADNGKIKLIALWAGDSRSYVLMPQKGLLQLTQDDNGVTDALEALRQAPKMNNTISASQDFAIRRKDYELDKPCMVFTASDGVFDYFPSPLLLEYYILNSLEESICIAEWRDHLREILYLWKHDDVSMALDLVGFNDFNEVKKAYLNRLEYLKATYGNILAMSDRYAQVLDEEKRLNGLIAEYNREKSQIEFSVKSIDDELSALMQKLEAIRLQITQLEADIQSKKGVSISYTSEISCLASQKDTKEEEKAPLNEKIIDAQKALEGLDIRRKLDELWAEAIKTWADYKGSYEEMLNKEPHREEPINDPN